MVFITAGMGGGSGTGATPVIARIAKGLRSDCRCCPLSSFGFRGNKQEQLAIERIDGLREQVDTLLIISNNNTWNRW